MRKVFTLISAVILTLFSAKAQSETVSADSLTVGFVTCYPGPEIFELYGHEAVRISGRMNGQPVDVVVNYGLFDFDSPGFVPRFVKGETDYKIGAQPTDLFLYPYEQRGSKVVERVLPLTQKEATELARALLLDTDSENNTYRYKYFSANCATKPIDHLNRISKSRFVPDDNGEQLTYRALLEKYNEGYPWYQLGIDLVLGSELDKPISAAEATFVPVELDSRYFGSLPQRELVKGKGDGNQRGAATPWFLTPMFVFWTIFAVVLLLILKTVYRRLTDPDLPGKQYRGLVAGWYALQGLVGMLVWFLTFLSEHEGTSPNFNAVWLNPLWLVVTILIWFPRCGKSVRFICVMNAILTALLLCAFPFLPQTLNASLIPLMLTTVLVSLFPIISKSKQ